MSVRASVKRCMDVAIAVVGLVLAAPVMAVVALAIRLTMGAPVLFRQIRPGLGGKPFVFYKFRSMTNHCDADGNLLPDECRLNRLGRFLRRTSIDELPQLWNVLKGDMSIVGPRPLLMEYLPLYTPEQARRHEVKPGVVGWAVVNGRNSRTWEEKFALDTWYVDHHSLLLDLKIMAMAVLTVVSGTGVQEAGRATMSRFTGSLTATVDDRTRRSDALS